MTTRLERIDARVPEGPRTRAEVMKWVNLGFGGFRKEGFEPTAVVATIPRPLNGVESAVRNGSTPLTVLITEAMRREAGTEIAIFNGGSIRIAPCCRRDRSRSTDSSRAAFGGTT